MNFEKKKTRSMSENLKQLVSKRNKGFVALLNSDQHSFTNQQNQCFKCTLKPLKPYRSYHCSTCERDIIYMDHHCVFANNCIGLYNLRYFLAFVLYSTVALGIITHSYVAIVEPPKKVTLSYYFFYSFFFCDLVLFVFMLPYCFWSWNLALNGKTHSEQRKGLFHGHNFCYAKKDKENPYGLDSAMEQHYSQLAQFIRTYKIDSWRENIFVIFGTWNVFAAVLLPMERTLPLRGLEWSFIIT